MVRFAGVSALALSVAAGGALAEVPRVAVDVAPVHSLVARVMQGVGEPDLVLPATASPHAHSLRPSEARALEAADLVVWIGPELTPWMADAIDRLAGDAPGLKLLEVEGAIRRETRTGARFGAHEHGGDDHHDDPAHDEHHDDHADDEHHDDHAHDEHHDDHAHDDHHDEHADGEHHDEHAHDDHHDDHAHDDAHGHAHEGIDPHAWLDPVNAGIWMADIAEALSELDPGNAAAYRANARAGRAEIDALIAEVEGRMAPLRGRPFIVFHDAYQYFEARFGLEAAGAISVSDASEPGPARVAEIRDLVAELGAGCVFAEPQFNRGMVDAVFEGSGATIGVIDPVGAELTPGPGFYPALIRGMADSFEACF
ncbi:zinc ABC transporter substrate-binding protein [Roseibacterium sp. SDUM158017]|uniref:zinc ABC transporter substrate-binding protein n=1 Tax=Roseicyclus salinarum TaxID=3036773 RepID=UPI002415205E|nr:zinc ABC transporter substrate-binding protein [Roseibacterium sp. SDUM158017]MDG4649680.1 zinc ABC transporter substrate-binding protein [Roseibacterium sp. SDUM158017]